MNEDPGAFVMPWGRHQGCTLDDIATSNSGLKELDRMRGWVKDPRVSAALDAYFALPVIQTELKRALGD